MPCGVPTVAMLAFAPCMRGSTKTVYCPLPCRQKLRKAQDPEMRKKLVCIT